MDKELIARQEAENDGQTVYLYFDEMVGMYLAFGLSAYYVTMAANPHVAFSDALKLPVALLRKGHVNTLRQAFEKVEHTTGSFYKFRMRAKIGDQGYEKWKSKVLEKMGL
ncbi:MAG: hypothetical protein K6F02_03390 [Prevotella sp.]|nr:hypothetical protein [Prevotella sp.]